VHCVPRTFHILICQRLGTARAVRSPVRFLRTRRAFLHSFPGDLDQFHSSGDIFGHIDPFPFVRVECGMRIRPGAVMTSKGPPPSPVEAVDHCFDSYSLLHHTRARFRSLTFPLASSLPFGPDGKGFTPYPLGALFSPQPGLVQDAGWPCFGADMNTLSAFLLPFFRPDELFSLSSSYFFFFLFHS